MKMLKKVGIGVGSVVAVAVVGCFVYFGFITPNPYKITDISTATAVQKTDKSVVVTEKSIRSKNKTTAKKVQVTLPETSAMPVINKVLPDKDIEGVGVKVENKTPMGVIAKQEYCRIIGLPEKVVKKSINCIDGFVDLTEFGISSSMEISLITNIHDGEKYFFLCDEKGEEVKFRYVASIGDLNGRQNSQIIKLFAVGIIKSEQFLSYVILECPNALGKGPRLNCSGTVCLFSPVVEGLKTEESTRQVLAELFYLDPQNIDLLLPQKIQVSQK